MKYYINYLSSAALFFYVLTGCAEGVDPEVPRAIVNNLSQDPESQDPEIEQGAIKSQASIYSQLNVEDLGDGSFKLSWDAVPGEEDAEYLVYYSKQLMGDEVPDIRENGIFFEGTADTTMSIQGLDVSEDYYFEVITSDSKGFRKLHNRGKGRIEFAVCEKIILRSKCIRAFGCTWGGACKNK